MSGLGRCENGIIFSYCAITKVNVVSVFLLLEHKVEILVSLCL